MLAVIFGTTNFALVMTPLQLIVLTLVTRIYIPCLASILGLWKSSGWKHALTISLVEIGLAHPPRRDRVQDRGLCNLTIDNNH